MAQEEGPPRKTTPFNKFSGMASQNDRYNIKDDEMFWLENIMRTGPRKLSSVPGPGPQISLFGNVSAIFPPIISGANCVEFTGSDQQFVNNNNCGYFFNLCVPAIYVGVDSGGNAYTQVKYKDNATGTAMSGPVLSVDGASTRTNFTGYGAIYNSTTHVITLGKWINQSLNSIPTSLGTITLPLATDDVLKISKNRLTNVVAVRVNGTLEISVADADIPFSNPGFGIAGVGATDDFSSQEWSNFSVSCADYVGSSSDQHCCDAAPVGLSIQCCSGSACEFSCNQFSNQPLLTIRACGGVPPYHWTSTGPAFVNESPSDSSFATVGFSSGNSFSNVSFGLRINSVTTNCVTPPSGSHEYFAANKIGVVQFEYDCQGNYLRWSDCTINGNSVSCATNEASDSVTTYPFSIVTTFPSDCPIGGLLPDGVMSFSIGGGGSSIPFKFGDPAECSGSCDDGCYSPVIGLPPFPFAPCHCCDYGIHAPTGEEIIEKWYNLTPVQSVGSPVIQVIVTDSLFNSASVVIDVV
jgi:hypothetical protein